MLLLLCFCLSFCAQGGKLKAPFFCVVARGLAPAPLALSGLQAGLWLWRGPEPAAARVREELKGSWVCVSRPLPVSVIQGRVQGAIWG